jgi:hypothetical protein
MKLSELRVKDPDTLYLEGAVSEPGDPFSPSDDLRPGDFVYVKLEDRPTYVPLKYVHTRDHVMHFQQITEPESHVFAAYEEHTAKREVQTRTSTFAKLVNDHQVHKGRLMF